MILLHIIVALTSLILAGFTSFSPTTVKLRVTYVFVFATIGSGTYLIFTTPHHIITTCIEGLVYIFFVTTAIVYATHKLDALKKGVVS